MPKAASKKRSFNRGGCVQLSNGKVGFVVRAVNKSNSKLVDVYLPTTKRTVSASRTTTRRKRCSKTMLGQKKSWQNKHPRRRIM